MYPLSHLQCGTSQALEKTSVCQWKKTALAVDLLLSCLLVAGALLMFFLEGNIPLKNIISYSLGGGAFLVVGADVIAGIVKICSQSFSKKALQNQEKARANKEKVDVQKPLASPQVSEGKDDMKKSAEKKEIAPISGVHLLNSSAGTSVIPMNPKVVLKETKEYEGNTITTHVASIDRFDQQHFETWVLKENPSPQKKALLQASIIQASKKLQELGLQKKDGSIHIEFSKIASKKGTFGGLCKMPLGSNKIDWTKKEGNYDYSNENGTYINAAIAHRFGGTYRSYGNVLEEIQFIEFIQYVLLDYITLQAKQPIHPVKDSSVSQNFFEPEPFVMQGMKRTWEFRTDIPPNEQKKETNDHQSAYGHGLTKIPPNEVSSRIRLPSLEVVPVNMIGIAAQNRSKTPFLDKRSYEEKDLQYHLKTLCLAFQAEKYLAQQQKREALIHFPKWGCGVFLNNEKVIFTLALLAAKMTGVKLIIYKASDDLKFQEFEKMVHQGKNAEEVIRLLLQVIQRKSEEYDAKKPKKR